MSVTVDYFFNSDKELKELRSKINECLGCDLRSFDDKPGIFLTQFMGLDFLFGMHSFENDRELDFESYKYSVGVKTWAPDGSLSEIRSCLMAMVVFVLYHRLGINKGMLVYDVQRLLARYEERVDENGCAFLFDTISQKYISFPDYLIEMGSR